MTYGEHVIAQNQQINYHLKMYALQLKIEFGKTISSNEEYAKICKKIDEILEKEGVIV